MIGFVTTPQKANAVLNGISQALLNILGGLDDRVDVDPADIIDPNAEVP